MLNDKEKQAIFKLREIIDYDKKHRLETIYDKEQIEFRNNIELVLDLLEKLQKENEELRVQGSIILLDYNILKDKIKAKIEELENEHTGSTRNAISVLRSLLEEE